MNKIAVTPYASGALYQGSFTEPRFGLLSNPVRAYENLLKFFSEDGVTLDSLRIDTTSLSAANISCSWPDLNVTIRLRIARFELSVLRLHEIGMPRAIRLLERTLSAIREIDPSAKLARHQVFANVYTRIEDQTYDDATRQWLGSSLEAGAKIGLTYRLPADPEYGSTECSIVVDRVPNDDRGLSVGVSVGFSAENLSADALPGKFQRYVVSKLDRLGIAVRSTL